MFWINASNVTKPIVSGTILPLSYIYLGKTADMLLNVLKEFLQETNIIDCNVNLKKWNKIVTETIPAGIYLFKMNNGNIRTMCEICSDFTKKTPERRQWRRSGVLLLTLNRFHILFWCFYCWLWTSKYRLRLNN